MGGLRFMTAGESHGAALTAILEGVPAGLRIPRAAIDDALARRQRGYGRGDRMKIETDRVTVLSGMRFGETLGSPLTLQVVNRDFENWTDRMDPFGAPAGAKVTAVRPGHADLTGVLKYERTDARDILERSSARETTMRVAVGAVCGALLRELGTAGASHERVIGGEAVNRAAIRDEDIGVTNSADLSCCDPDAAVRMKARIDAAKAVGDTLGGIFEIVVRGLPAGRSPSSLCPPPQPPQRVQCQYGYQRHSPHGQPARSPARRGASRHAARTTPYGYPAAPQHPVGSTRQTVPSPLVHPQVAPGDPCEAVA